MDNHIITILQNFQKPEASFLQDKECLICLETFDLESNKIVKLPCGCSNSVYHINCIIQFLKSGTSKNFCPHCKINYNILQPVLEDPPVVNNNDNNDINHIRMFVTILYIHILSNSIMNVINISESKDYPEEDNNILSKLLVICYFCKLFVNIWIVCKLKVNTEKIESYLNLSYTIQSLLFILFIYLMSCVKKDYNSIILIINNIFFYFGDIAFRIAFEYKMKNTVHIVE
jgi:hypothetical protein